MTRYIIRGLLKEIESLSLNYRAIYELILLKDNIMEIIKDFNISIQSELKKLAQPISDEIYYAELEIKPIELL